MVRHFVQNNNVMSQKWYFGPKKYEGIDLEKNGEHHLLDAQFIHFGVFSAFFPTGSFILLHAHNVTGTWYAISYRIISMSKKWFFGPKSMKELT